MSDEVPAQSTTASRGGRQRAPGAGRPRKPTKLKVLEGTFRKDRANAHEPRVAVLRRLAPPSWLRRLGDNGIAVQFWRRCVPKLVATGILAETDVEAFANTCETYSLYRRAVAQIPKKLRAKKGFPVALTVRARCKAELHKDLMSFGLNPAARAKVIAGGDLDLPVPVGAAQQAGVTPGGSRGEAWLRTYGQDAAKA